MVETKMEQNLPKIKSAADQVREHIQKAIFAGEIKPGTWLKEKDIGEWLGVSRTPIREAFRILSAEGLLEISSNKGVRVVCICKEDLADLFEVRLLLESHCLRKLVETATERNIQNMAKLLDAVRDAMHQGDVPSYFSLAYDFHDYLIEQSRNARLIAAYSVLKNSIRCAQLLLLKDPQGYRLQEDEHKAILDAIRERDADKAVSLLQSHMEMVYKRMVGNIDSEKWAACEGDIV